MTVISSWVGATTPSSARIIVEVSSTATVNVLIDTDPSLLTATVVGPVTPTAENIASVSITGLDPDTRYYFGVEHDTTLDANVGEFLTFPPVDEPASFVFGASGDAGATPDFPGVGGELAGTRVSNHPVFDTIRERAINENWLFFFHLGDLHYYDLGSGSHGIVGGGSLANYRRGYSDVLLQPRQAELYRRVATRYVWDDHDYGSNDSDGTLTDKANAAQVYRERVPHDTLATSDAIYHSFQVGRVLFIVSDTRYNRTPNIDPDSLGKTMLGSGQKTFIEDTLTNTTAEFFIWILPSQWMGLSDDSYAAFMSERSEMIGIFNATGFRERMCIVSADVHALAIDTGTGSPGAIPVFQFAGLDADFAAAQTHYDTGPTQPGRNQYGTIEVEDTGTSITITGSGWIEEALWGSHSFTVVTEEPTPEPEPPELPDNLDFTGQPNYNYIFMQSLSRRVVKEIPLYGVSMNTILNGGFDFTGTFTMDMTGFRNQDLVNATDPGRTSVIVERDGFPVWDGNVISRVYQSQSKSMQIFARSISAYPYRVKMDASYFPNGFVIEDMEQTEAFLLLWSTLQSKAESDLDVFLPSALATGITKTIDVQPHEDKYFGDVMDEIANGDDGFDWRITTIKVDSSQFVRVLEIGYPTLGDGNHNRIVFDYPGSIINYWRTEGVNDSGTHVHGLGSGSGADMLRFDVTHETLIALGYLRWDFDLQFKDITEAETVASMTRQAASISKTPKRTYSIELRGSETPEFGSYLPGDACTLKINDAAHPDGFRFETRIIGWRLTPPSSNELEKVSVYFEGAEGGF